MVRKSVMVRAEVHRRTTEGSTGRASRLGAPVTGQRTTLARHEQCHESHRDRRRGEAHSEAGPASSLLLVRPKVVGLMSQTSGRPRVGPWGTSREPAADRGRCRKCRWGFQGTPICSVAGCERSAGHMATAASIYEIGRAWIEGDGHDTVTTPRRRPGLPHRERDRKSTRLNSSHSGESRMPSSA